MSLMLLLVSASFAARVYWTSPPDAVSAAAVARTVPDAPAVTPDALFAAVPLDALFTGGQPVIDSPQWGGDYAIAALRTELAAVRPLINEFDGELQIMARLQKATADVHLLRSTAERDLLWEALVFQGFAVDRYFQDKLGLETAAKPYRTGDLATARVSAWIDASALLGAQAPSTTLLPEADQRIGYDDAQAFSRAMPSSTFVLGDLAAGAEVRIDGSLVESGRGTRVTVVPGRHLASVRVGDTFLWAYDRSMVAGIDVLIQAPYGHAEHAAFKSLVESGTSGWIVPAPAMAVIAAAGEPSYVATPDGDRTRILRLDGGTATPVPIAKKVRELQEGFSFRAAAGAGWVSTGDFLLQNGADGAPETRETVNAGTPAVSIGGEYRYNLLALGVGVDAQFALGEHHSLPTGESLTRSFIYPHAAFGVPWAQLTIGPLFPFYLGIGAKGHLPVKGPLELFASGVYGIGLERARGEDPVFEPLPAWSAWGGVAVKLP